MTDQELGAALVRLWSDCNEDTSIKETPLQRFGRRARELLAGEAKPVATWEAAQKFWHDQFKIKSTYSIVECIMAALAHFAPPAPELPPICGMTALEIVAVLDAKLSVFSTQNCISGRRRILEACARIIHDLAQPVTIPVVDPDTEAKRLAWIYYSHLNFMPGRRFKTSDEYWSLVKDSDIGTAMRAVAAAKMEGGE